MSSPGWIRTSDLSINSRTLCQLSYGGSKVAQTIARKIRPDESGCWLWTGAVTSSGYGSVGVNGRSESAHRHLYALLVAPIPAGLEIDHLCRVRLCVNPDHLEPVTRAENLRRAREHHVPKRACKYGHSLTGTAARAANGMCRECDRQRKRTRPESLLAGAA